MRENREKIVWKTAAVAAASAVYEYHHVLLGGN
jgi:hypothetical protein